jgi:hypothetical protein
MTTTDGHIFISYARADGSVHATTLQEKLEERGHTCWRDTRDLNRTQDFTAEIEIAIEDRNACGGCVTPDIKRPESFVRREIGYAQVCKKPITPLILDATAKPPITIQQYMGGTAQNRLGCCAG